MRVLKFPLGHTGRQSIQLPAGAKIIAVQGQFDLCHLWVQTTSPGTTERRTFVCAFTGDEIADNLQHLGTCQFHHGATVVHVFEEIAP